MPCGPGLSSHGIPKYCRPNDVLIDPFFWECLGKNQGWKDIEYTKAVGPIQTGRPIVKIHRRDWVRNMHHFIDHLVEGDRGSMNSFFEKLIK